MQDLNSGANYKVMADTDDFTVMTTYEPQGKDSSAYQSEAALEEEFIRILCSQGYERLDVHDEPGLIDNLRVQLEALNGIEFSDKEWKRLFAEYLARPNESIVEKAQRVQRDYVYEFVRDDGTHVNIRILDKNIVTNNRLQVMNQYVAQGKHETRYDVTILVNGLPMVHVELKRRGVDLREAFNQIDRYQRDSFWSGCGLFEYAQLFVISNGTLTKYYSNTTRFRHVTTARGNRQAKRKTSDSFEFTSFWADAGNRIIPDLVHFARTFLERRTLMNIITRYCVLTSENMLMVMRPYQIAATERVLNRILVSEMNPSMLGTIDAGGYIWHATGSGKTLTSFKCSQLACGIDGVDKVLFVVDRKDLDYQSRREYDRFEKGAVDHTDSTGKLAKLLGDDSARIAITTINKLSNFVKQNPKHKVYGKHVVIIFDECHRSQFGEMRRLIGKRFKKYHIFGFTGTPIFPKNAHTADDPLHPTTEQMFGSQLHRYTIVDAIRDGNVLPFRIDYIDTVQAGDVRDGEVYDIDREGARLNEGRIREIATYVLDKYDIKTKQANHYTLAGQRVHGFNSIFACESIPAAKAYYKMFKDLQRERGGEKLKIALMYSWAANEEEIDGILVDEELDTSNLDQSSRDYLDAAIRDYNDMFGTSYDTGSGFEGYYENISEKMKNRELDMLIVVNMFLTGFDATTLNTLWVDKNLKLHGLIQAFSRTNRILNSVKTFGNVVCFRKLEDQVEEALSVYGDDHAGGIVVLKPYSEYFNKYQTYVNRLLMLYPLDMWQDVLGTEMAKRDFVLTFGSILRLRNVLTAWEQFEEDDPLTPIQVQEYQGLYIYIYHELRKPQEKDQADIVDDLKFEVELVKQVEVNIDYILELVQKYHDENCANKEIVADIERAISASLSLRDKRELINRFIDKMSAGENAHEAWVAFIREEMKNELDCIISEENLKPEETEAFMALAFAEGFVNEEGTAVTKILRPRSRFGKNAGHAGSKARAVERLKEYFEKYREVAPSVE